MKILQSDKERHLIDRSLERFGLNSAADTTVERCAELIVELHRYSRGDSSLQDIARTMSGVQLGLAHMQRFVGERTYQSALNAKLGVLREKLDGLELADQIKKETE